MNSTRGNILGQQLPPEVNRPPRFAWLADSPYRVCLRASAGLIFFLFGMKKLLGTIALGTGLIQLPTGPQGFAVYLAAVGVPFPMFNSYMVLAVEILCGLGLLFGICFRMSHHITRLFSLALMGDMSVATLLVGLRNLMNQPVVINGVPVTDQLWRLPLELGLLVCMLYFTVYPLARSLRRRSRALPPAHKGGTARVSPGPGPLPRRERRPVAPVGTLPAQHAA
jgi:putative oxidoreductase